MLELQATVDAVDGVPQAGRRRRRSTRYVVTLNPDQRQGGTAGKLRRVGLKKEDKGGNHEIVVPREIRRASHARSAPQG